MSVTAPTPVDCQEAAEAHRPQEHVTSDVRVTDSFALTPPDDTKKGALIRYGAGECRRCETLPGDLILPPVVNVHAARPSCR